MLHSCLKIDKTNWYNVYLVIFAEILGKITYQFGFQKGKSTHMALITLIDKITEALDQGELVIGIFYGFSKAFGTVDDDIHLHKLEVCAVQDIALNGLIVIYLYLIVLNM